MVRGVFHKVLLNRDKPLHEFHSLECGVRRVYTHAYLFENSRFMLERAEDASEAQYYYCTSSIIFSVLSLEAFINYYGDFLYSNWLECDAKYKPSLKDKAKALRADLGIYGETLSHLLDIRDRLVHARTSVVPAGQHDIIADLTLVNAREYHSFVKKFILHMDTQSGASIGEFEIFNIFEEATGISKEQIGFG